MDPPTLSGSNRKKKLTHVFCDPPTAAGDETVFMILFSELLVIIPAAQTVLLYDCTHSSKTTVQDTSNPVRIYARQF
jgi:hypothetical protein